MLLLNALTLVAGITTVSCRSIGDIIPTLRLPNALSPSSPMKESQCLFAPHEPAQRTPSASYIPPHAWRHISSLLASYTPLTTSQSKVQTLRISDLVNDASLEGIVLGLVYTVPEPSAADKELRSLDGSGNEEVWGPGMGREEGDRRCLAEAVSQVEQERLMEGVLQVQGRWRVGFLVYMVD